MKSQSSCAKIKIMTKIAIIEDNTVINQMYRMKFEVEGFDVQVASNGQDRVKLVKKFRPDIILLDLQMPGMNGDEALAQIRSEVWGKKIPVIILTNTGKEEAPQGLGALGIEGYIVKAEMTPKQVVSRVKESLDKN